MGKVSKCYSDAEQATLISSLLQLYYHSSWLSATTQQPDGLGATVEVSA